jgi:excisionase family DNA binding protein
MPDNITGSVSPIDGKLLCSIKEATTLLGVGRTSIYEMMSRGQIASLRLGSRRLIKMSSLVALVEQAEGEAA